MEGSLLTICENGLVAFKSARSLDLYNFSDLRVDVLGRAIISSNKSNAGESFVQIVFAAQKEVWAISVFE